MAAKQELTPEQQLSVAIVAVMGEVQVVKKGQKHDQGFMFTTDADMVFAVKSSMVKHGLWLAPVDIVELGGIPSLDVCYETRSQKKMWRQTMKWIWEISHIGGASKQFSTIGCGADTGDKHPMKAATGAKKYAIEQLFLVARSNTLEPESPLEEPAAETKEKEKKGKKGKDRKATSLPADDLPKDNDQPHEPKVDKDWKADEKAFWDTVEGLDNIPGVGAGQRDVCDWLASKGRPHPMYMTSGRRADVVAYFEKKIAKAGGEE